MSRGKVQDLLQQLRRELGSAEADPHTLALMRELDATLQAHGDAGADAASTQSITDRVRDLEARFAARHEGAERVLRQVVDLLGKMGV